MTCAAIACVLLIGGPVQVIGGHASVEITQAGATYVITFQNALVKSLTVEPWTVDLNGLTVSGSINSRGGDKPDDLVVVPPAGFWCDPCSQTVDETGEGQVVLYPEVAA